MKYKSWKATGAVLGASLLATGCATTSADMPTAQLTRTQEAISESIEQGARETAAAELAAAEENFEAAQAAAADKEYEVALIYAQKAEADAKLAEARAERADTASTLAELQENIRVLQDEMNRQLERSDEQS